MVSITYGHGYLNDFSVTTNWTEVAATAGNGTFTTTHGDYATLENTGGAVDYSVDNDDAAHINLSVGPAGIYADLLYRYRCSNSNVKAQIIVEMDGGVGTQEIALAESNSATFVVGTYAFVATDILDHILLYANDATGIVYYDFCLVYQDVFTFPNVGYDVTGTIPNRNVFLPIPMRQTDITQQLGSGNMEYQLGIDMTMGDWTRATDDVNGQVFYDIAGEAPSEPWQWFDSEREQMKVTLEPPRFTRAALGQGLIDRMDLTLREYRLSDGDNALESYATRWGLDL